MFSDELFSDDSDAAEAPRRAGGLRRPKGPRTGSSDSDDSVSRSFS